MQIGRIIRALERRVKKFLGGSFRQQQIFTDIHRENRWGGQVSNSGTGSDLIQTEAIRRELLVLIKEYNIKSVLDAPCGDFFWMKEIKSELSQLIDKYYGIDVVKKVIQENQSQYGDQKFEFTCRDMIRGTLPKADLILCRDGLVHLSTEEIKNTLENFKRSGAKYLLTTTFTERKANKNIRTGMWQPLNLEKAPINLPKPIRKINENCTEVEGKYSDKSLGFWRLTDL